MKLFDLLTPEGIYDVARREIMSRRRIQLLRVGVMLLVLIAAVMVTLWFCYLENRLEIQSAGGPTAEIVRDASRQAGSALMVVFYLLFGLFAMLSASSMFPELADKQRRIQFMMTPESTADKFFGRFAVYVLLFTVVFLVCAVIALLLGVFLGRMAYAPVFDIMQFDNPVRRIIGVDKIHLVVWPLTMLLIAYVSFFVTGSVAFPKLTFIKTYALLVVVQIFMQTLVPMAGLFFFSGSILKLAEDIAPKPWAMEMLSVTGCLLLGLLTLFNWCMGYIWLRNTDVIE